jgi:TrmH family RNA methyltransferase
VITSPQNPRVKHLVRLRESSHRRRQERFLIEGTRELERALAARWPLESVYFCSALFHSESAFDLLHTIEESAAAELVELNEAAFRKAAFRQGPDGFLAVGIYQTTPLSDLALGDPPFLLVLEGIEKPGNLGAIVRSAHAAGVDGLILADAHTDPFNPNAIRAAQGASFHLPMAQADSAAVLQFLEEKGIQPVLTTPAAEHLLWDEDLSGPVALVLGAEDEGLSELWLHSAHVPVRLPMNGVTDSLNLAATAAIALFETVRQRTL